MKTRCGPSRLVILTVILGLTQLAAQKVPAFTPRDYPSTEYKVTRTSHTLGDLSIQITHAKKRQPDGSAPCFCRAWVDVHREKKLVRRIFYGDFEPVGFSYGVFVPAKQPSEDYFALVKVGDYDGRLLLIDKQGAVTDLMGGFFFVTADGRFIVSKYSSDLSGLAVFDLQLHKLLFKTEDVPDILQWYKNTSGYFFTVDDSPQEENIAIYRLNLKTAKLMDGVIDLKKLRAATKVRYDFDPRKLEDCTSR